MKHAMKGLIAAVLTTITLVAPSVSAQPARVNRDSFEQRVAQAFDDKDYAKAAEMLEAHLERVPNDFIALYNAACAFSQLSEEDKAANYLFRSVEAGFVDFDHIVADADLDNIREHPVYARILELRDEVYATMGARQMETAREEWGTEGYRYETDETRHINFATALDEVSHREMREMLEAQADHLVETLFEAPPTYFTLVAVPTPDDAQRLIRDGSIGGIYEHPRRRLVARDIGIMLRHEFTHLMHYGHMERLKQNHALWVQEGLAALYETYVLNDNGAIRFLPNQRHNFVRMMMRQNQLPAWRDLFSTTGDEFMDDAGENYPVVRSVFQFLDSHKKLVDWYKAYIETFDEDETGIAAFEKVFEAPLEDIERRWRTWVRAQPPVDDYVRPGDASLGVQFVEDGSNDGVLIDRVLENSAAAEAGIQPGDIIVSFDSQPVRSHFELLIAVGTKQVGEVIPVRIRRDGEYQLLLVTLKPLR
jgi:hypothetical protein